MVVVFFFLYIKIDLCDENKGLNYFHFFFSSFYDNNRATINFCFYTFLSVYFSLCLNMCRISIVFKSGHKNNSLFTLFSHPTSVKN